MSKCCFGGFPILPTVKFLRECVCVCVRMHMVVWVGQWAAVWEGGVIGVCVWVGGSAGGGGFLNNNGLSESLE